MGERGHSALMEIQPGGVEHAEAVRLLHRTHELSQYEVGLVPYLRGVEGTLLVAIEEGEVVGLVAGRPGTAGYWRLELLLTLPLRRGIGVGARLLEAFTLTAESAGALGIYGCCPHSAELDRFYERNQVEVVDSLVLWDRGGQPHARSAGAGESLLHRRLAPWS